MNLHGVLPVLHTPYHANFEVDYTVLKAEIEFALQQGADGVVFALASEVLRLTPEERRSVAESIVNTVNGRKSVTISVGAESTFAAVQYARHAESIGATAMMAIPPVSVSLEEDQLRAYYGAILEATTIPLVVQDASSYVGKAMSVGFQAGLRNTFGERVLFKPESSPVGPLITALHAATGNQAKVFEGSGGTMLVENFRRGVTGTMPGTDIITAIVALWKALEAGDDTRIYAISPLISSLLSLAHGLDGYLALEKYLLFKQGVFQNRLVRPPLGFVLDPFAEKEIDRLFERLQAAL